MRETGFATAVPASRATVRSYRVSVNADEDGKVDKTYVVCEHCGPIVAVARSMSVYAAQGG